MLIHELLEQLNEIGGDNVIKEVTSRSAIPISLK